MSEPQNTNKQDLPPEARGWSWGAFLLTWIWGLGNRVWISLLMFVPFVNIIMWFVLGAKGRQWAWEKGGWRDVEHFVRVQRLWAIWGVGILVGWVALFAALFLWVGDTLKDNDAVRAAVERVSQDERVVEVLGEPLETTGWPTGSFQVSSKGGTTLGYVDASIDLRGPKGEGTMQFKSFTDAGEWTFVQLVVKPQVADAIQIIELSPESEGYSRYESLIHLLDRKGDSNQ